MADTEVRAATEGSAEAAAERAMSTEATATPVRACDVLIVDDTGGSRELLAAVLRNFAGSLRLAEARNGTEALASWRSLDPHVTLLDIDMPGIDGLTLLETMRAERPGCFVAMVSGRSSLDAVKTALARGASGFVVKPYKPQRILDLLKKYQQATGVSLIGD